MFRLIRALVAFLGWIPAFAGMTALAGTTYQGIGRVATPDEIAAWDIDVRPDFKGLPKGSGSVADGQKIWDAKCASCHGTFGESNEVFTPLVGGTTAADMKSGRVGTLVTGGVARTTLMKVSTISTLWDYIRRAMPWNAPKSLTNDEVYAVLAYLLNLGDILPDTFVLSDANIAEVQLRLPNRNGMTRNHGLWDIKGKSDVANVACMKDCETEVHLASQFPEFARGSHGDLSEQNRPIGATASAPAPSKPAPVAVAHASPDPAGLARSRGCLACHATDGKVVGPAFRDVAARYKGDAAAASNLAKRIRGGSAGAWGATPMPPNSAVSQSEAEALAQWVLGL
ncbi:MAG TPA: c-type cytochrome [Usitatibacter sp.]|nr:c-type cytochrome [Usitatibacter sp.]